MCIVTDNGWPFKNEEVSELCEKFNIYQCFATPYYPQSNDQVEATNKTILKILKKVVNDSERDWHLQLNPSLWAYRTCIRMETSTTPFSLVYGAEAILPIEIELPSLRVSLKNIISEENYRVARLQELEFLDEKWQNALKHLQYYQNRMRRSYNKWVKPRCFEIGYIILKKNQINLVECEKIGKFEPNWLGPFVITKVIGNGAYHLQTIEGDSLPDPINSMHLKIYYI